MESLTSKQFFKLAREQFSHVLEPYGFSCVASKYCTFYREVSENIYHFILVDRLIKRPRFDIHVFPHSPLIDDDFHIKFPDNLGITTDLWGFLHSKTGVGPDQELYFGRTKEGFLRNFSEKVEPALINFAIPFLDQINTIQDFSRFVKSKHYVEKLNELLNGVA